MGPPEAEASFCSPAPGGWTGARSSTGPHLQFGLEHPVPVRAKERPLVVLVEGRPV